MPEYHINPLSGDDFKKYMRNKKIHPVDTVECNCPMEQIHKGSCVKLPLVQPVLTRTRSFATEPIDIPPPVFKKPIFTNDITIKNKFENKIKKQEQIFSNTF